MDKDRKELLDTVEALAKQLNDAKLDGIEVETDDFRIKLTKHHRPSYPPIPHMPPPNVPGVPMPMGDMTTVMTQQAELKTPTASGRFIKSPIIGTFYAAASPGQAPFVTVGDKVTKGSVVCIVESMKLMNEITSDFDGTVAEVLVSDGEAVEYDQPLIRVE